MRKLRLPRHETDPKCNTSIRASSTAAQYVQAIRAAIIKHMAAHPEQRTPLFPTDVNNDLVIRIMCRVIGRDYDINVYGEEEE